MEIKVLDVPLPNVTIDEIRVAVVISAALTMLADIHHIRSSPHSHFQAPNSAGLMVMGDPSRVPAPIPAEYESPIAPIFWMELKSYGSKSSPSRLAKENELVSMENGMQETKLTRRASAHSDDRI